MARPKSNPWLYIPVPVAQPRLRLFCFPFAGGSALVYRTWPASLPADVEVCAVQLPGRGSRFAEPLFRRFDAVVDALMDALAPVLRPPFVFFGHSMGAMLAFEVTRRLRRHGASMPLHLLVSAHRAPHLPDDDPHLHALPEAEFVSEIRRLGGTPEEVLQEPELMQIMVPILRADFSVVESREYVDEPPLDIPITAFGGLTDRRASTSEVEAWRTHTRGDFAAHMFPGGHFFLDSARAALLHEISRTLERVRTPEG